MNQEVFISYSSKNQDIVELLCEHLEKGHIRCWFAKKDILPGAKWGESITIAIQQSKLMIIILSKDSILSEQIENELVLASDMSKLIIPIYIEEVKISKSMEYYMSKRQHYFAIDKPFSIHLNRICEIIRQNLDLKEKDCKTNLSQATFIKFPYKTSNHIFTNNYIDSTLSQQGQKQNPFYNRAMITDPNRFCGRKNLISKIYSRINNLIPQSISIYGERRIGKSSILSFISNMRNFSVFLSEPSNYTFIYVDIQRIRSVNIKDFFKLLSHQIQKNIPVKLDYLPSYEGFHDLIENLSQKNLKIIILFDEFDLITKNKNFDEEFYSFLRSLANQFSVAYITSSLKRLQELCFSKKISDSPFFNIFTEFRVLPFSEEESLELITSYLESVKAEFTFEKYYDTIYNQAGNLPFFLQISCSNLYDTLLSGSGLELIDETFLEEAKMHFDYIWDCFDNNEKDICFLIINKRKIPNNKKFRVQSLLNKGYLKKENGTIKVFSTVFEQYLKSVKKDRSKTISILSFLKKGV